MHVYVYNQPYVAENDKVTKGLFELMHIMFNTITV